MIERLPDTPAHVVAFRMSGRIEDADIDRIAERFDRALSAHEQVNFFMEIASLEGVSAKAVLKDLQVGLGQIKNLRRIHRMAVVADQEWIRTGTDWEDRLFPQIDLRAFEPSERDEALAWASETPPDAGPPKRGLEEIPTKRRFQRKIPTCWPSPSPGRSPARTSSTSHRCCARPMMSTEA